MEQYTEVHKYHEVVRGGGHDHCKGLVEHLQRRVDDLVRENTELMQKTQVVVKKVETNIVEKKPGLDEETVQRITDLERRLSEAELIRDEKIREVEALSVKVVKFNDLRGELDVLRNRNGHLEQQLNEKIQELEALRVRFAEFSELREKDRMIIAEKERDLMELHKRLQELEVLPNQIAAAKKNAEILSAEVDRLTVLARERDQEMELLHKKIHQFESLKCINPRDHEELQARLRQIEALEAEIAELKNKYTSLCTEYEKEITIVRSKDKEIDGLNRSLQQNIKEARAAIDKELTHEEKLEREIEALVKRLEEKRLEVEEWKKRASLVPDLEHKLKHLESEFFKLQDRCKRLEEINSQYATKIEGLNAEIATLRDNLKNRERLYAELEREKMALVAEFEKAQRESSAMLAKVNEKKNAEIEALNARIASLSNELIALQKDISALKAECDHLNAEKLKIQKALQEHTAQEKELFARCEALRKEKELLAKEIADLAAEKQNLKGIAITKDKEAHALDKDLHHLAKENERLKALIADFEKKWAGHTHLIEERETEIRSLRDSLANVTNSQKQLVVERDRLLSENSHLVHRISELEESVTIVTSKYNKLEKIYNELRGATAQLDKVHDKLVETCVETEKISHQGPEIIQSKKKVKEEVHHEGRTHHF